jgi:hypothetical protein
VVAGLVKAVGKTVPRRHHLHRAAAEVEAVVRRLHPVQIRLRLEVRLTAVKAKVEEIPLKRAKRKGDLNNSEHHIV